MDILASTLPAALILTSLRIHILDWIGQDLERENVVRDWCWLCSWVLYEHLHYMTHVSFSDNMQDLTAVEYFCGVESVVRGFRSFLRQCNMWNYVILVQQIAMLWLLLGTARWTKPCSVIISDIICHYVVLPCRHAFNIIDVDNHNVWVQSFFQKPFVSLPGLSEAGSGSGQRWSPA